MKKPIPHTLLLPVIVLLSLGSCQKNAVITQAVASGYYKTYPSTPICDQSTTSYLIDLDGDGSPDARIHILLGQQNLVECQHCYNETDYFVLMDSILNPQFKIAKIPQSTFYFNGLSAASSYRMGDTISARGCYADTAVGVTQAWHREYCDYTSGDNLGVTNQYYAFEKTDASGTRYGWLRLHFAPKFALYLDAVYLSATPGQMTRAGIH